MNKLFVAYFHEEDDVLGATRAAREAGYEIHDVYTPFAVHGMDDAMGLAPSKLTWVCFGAGLTGLSIAFALQAWTSAVDWPLVIGGKPFLSAPAFVPVCFELTVLLAALSTVAALFLRCGLRPSLKPPKVNLPRATDDRFVLAVRAGGDGFNADDATSLFKRFRVDDTFVVEVPA